MARGDWQLFNKFLEWLSEGVFNLETDTIKLGIIDNVVTPAQDTATPTWDGTSSQEYDGNEVSTAGGYPAGGLTLSGPETNLASNVLTFDDDDSNLTLSQDGSGFTDGYWGIMYSDTATNKNAIGYVDLGGPVSEQDGAINLNFNASGIFTVTLN